MILEQLILKNIFSYYGEQRLELMPPGGRRNVVVIHGRNGQGKTSLLNALKLLLGGVTEELRKTTHERTLRPNEFVLGTNDEWLGLFNRRALQSGNLEASVEGVFRHAGRRIRLSRTWTRENSPQGFLARQAIQFLDIGDEQFDDGQSFLEYHFPASLIPFFLFDGELVQRMAEDGGEDRRRAIDAILELTPFDALETALEQLGSSVRQNQEASTVRRDLVNCRTELTQLDGNLELHEDQYENLTNSVREIQEELQHLEETTTGIVEQGAARRGEGTRQQLSLQKQRVKELQEEVLNTLRAGPTAFATGMSRAALDKLSELARRNIDSQTAQAELIDFLLESGPRHVFDSPRRPMPPPERYIVDFYRERLIEFLKEQRPEPPPQDLQLTTIQRERLHERLTRLLNTSTATQTRPLRELAEVRQSVSQLENDLQEMGSQQEEERQRLKQVKEKQQDLRIELGKLLEKQETTKREIVQCQNERTRIGSRLQQLEAQLVTHERNKRKLAVLQALKGFTDDFQKLCRDTRRLQIQEGVTRHFHRLFDSNRQIDHIHIAQNFSMVPRNTRGIEVGRSSLSAGTKQLMALALLWTLTELSKRDSLLAIDTPLARLDKTHQEKVLTEYLPNVSRQVLLLPTDSELDADKQRLIAPYIYKEYRLINERGDSTRIEELPQPDEGLDDEQGGQR